ncbi:MAG: DUF951 domain-containing protein [Clostridia bacterium]|nr:DUF951 domain-containing protein [Clostridia bacterium]MBR4657932.1 DUF951 domain-containing protein [Clostridia bacterium]MBR6110236.1 DUF951 domain-containing protein [Clostridia bacterium]
MDNDFTVGDRVIMRKPHACGSSEWEITRTGADVKIKCSGCGRIVMLDRGDFMRAAKKLLKEEASPGEAAER